MICCVEDDGSIRDLMLYALRAAGFTAEGFADGAALFRALEHETPELILLDIMLPGEDGLSVLKRLRQTAGTAQIPVIMATARGTEYDKVTGLDAGADDYLAKPFGMMEMLSRIRAVLRRTRPRQTGERLCVGPLALDMSAHAAFADGQPVALTRKEYELLRVFLENPGRVFTRDQLLARVWGVDYVGETRTVDVHIGTLRTKLGPSGDAVETVRGVGYRLTPV